VQILDLDLFDNTAEDIQLLHDAGKKVICYFSAGTSETWRPDFAEFRAIDQAAALPQWPGEHWLDIRNWEVLRIMRARIRLAAWKGCDAIDPDNMDGYSNENGGGFVPPLTQKDSIKYTKALARYAREWGLTMGLKNAMEIMPFVIKELAFAVNEQCGEDDGGCEDYKQMLLAVRGRKMPVYHIEYVTDPKFEVSNATSMGNDTAVGKWTFGAAPAWAAGMSADDIKSKLCLDKYPDLQGQMSTVIKVGLNNDDGR
jgi:endo-alpha-1,4-polygalactosaminidase (GH114 family)